MEKISIFYFSGTGNTYLMVNKAKEILEKQGYEVLAQSMEKECSISESPNEIMGLFFPVAMQSTFPNVWEFVNKLPEGKGKKTFMVDTMESFSGGVVGPMKKILVKKGYECIGAKELKMPSSMQTKAGKEGTGKAETARKELEIFIRNLLESRTSWKRVPVLSDAMRAISAGHGIWKSYSQKKKIDDKRCIKCGLCIKNCPTKALDMYDNHVRVDHDRCISCMRCANYCPKNAFTMSGKYFIQKRTAALKDLR